MRTINVNEEGFLKLLAIKKTRPQDASRAATFDHILYIYEESLFKPEHERGIIPQTLKERLKVVNAPIIDAEKPRSAEELRKLAPTRNNMFVQIGDVKKP